MLAISRTYTRTHTHSETHRTSKTMSPSSTGDSPHSATATTITAANAARPFPAPSRENFSIDIPASALTATNGNGSSKSALKSPTALKTQRQPSFSREGILGSAQKARNMSQSSDNRLESIAMQQEGSDDGGNPLKRRSTDAGLDYPRRRATIAVCPIRPPPTITMTICIALTNVHSVKSAGLAKVVVMAQNQNASFVQ